MYIRIYICMYTHMFTKIPVLLIVGLKLKCIVVCAALQTLPLTFTGLLIASKLLQGKFEGQQY